MKKTFAILFSIVFLTAVLEGYSQDSISKKQIRKENRIEKRIYFRQNYQRFAIKAGYVFASLTTRVTFDLADDLLSARLGLERNLGFPDRQAFFNGSFYFQATPRSGIYANYYGINRQSTDALKQDIIFLRDTIPAGTKTTAYFNTHVLSAGYMLTVLQDQRVFLGAYLNLYFMNVSSGIRSDIGDVNLKFGLTAPLPNFGLLMNFKIAKWFYLDGAIGFFALNTQDFGGGIYNLTGAMIFRPAKWVGISLSYQIFDIDVHFLADGIRTNVEYNFKRPSIGLSFTF